MPFIRSIKIMDLPYIAYGLCIWNFPTFAAFLCTGEVICDGNLSGNTFTGVFGMNMLGLVKSAACGFLLSVCAIPASFGLRLMVLGNGRSFSSLKTALE
jgi:hypothetical protein